MTLGNQYTSLSSLHHCAPLNRTSDNASDALQISITLVRATDWSAVVFLSSGTPSHATQVTCCSARNRSRG
jgi:hypothetical protein